jgi:hypothetical protein
MTDPIVIPEPNEKMNIVDTASLTFFTNPAYYGILQRKKLCNVKDNAEEVKFYRKRIVALFKDILKESDQTVNKEIKEIHSLFVNAAIRYFEMLDKKDIIQGQHIQGEHIQGEHIQGQHKHIQGQHIQGQHIQGDESLENENADPEDILNSLGGSELFTIDEANDIMMRKTITVANLDNYVITKQEHSSNETRIIPFKLEIDLKTNDLKTKGVPPKKNKNKKTEKTELINN